MKILFVTSSYYPAVKMGGPLLSVRALAEKLVAMGHDVTVVSTDWDLDYKINIDVRKDHFLNGVHVRFFSTREPLLKRIRFPGFEYTNTRILGSDWDKWISLNILNYDLVDIQIPFLQMAIKTANLCSRYGIKYFYHQRGVLDQKRLRINFYRKWIYLLLRENKIIKNASRLIALTEYEANSFRSLKLNNQIEIIPNGVSCDNSEIIDNSVKIDQLTNFINGKRVFLWMSRIHETKGADIYVEAFIRMCAKREDFVGILAGPDEIGLENELKQKITNLGLNKRLFFAGPVTGKYKQLILDKSDCFIFPTRSEGFSMVLLEALLNRCVAITSPGAHFSELEFANAGFVIDRTIEAYVKMMEQFLELSIRDVNIMQENAKKLVEESYNWNNITLSYEKLAELVLNEP